MPMTPHNPRAVSIPSLAEIWGLYIEFRRAHIAPSTYNRDYRRFTRRIERMAREAPQLRTSLEIRNWLLTHYSPETTRRTIQQFNAAYQWAMDSQMVTTQPFIGLGRHLKPKRPSDKNWTTFTLEERDRIIAAIDEQALPYGPWVRFLFWTGCRPEEARALTWEDVSSDHREILFCKAWPMGEPAPQQTKNYNSTRFPCGDRLSRFLRSLPKGDRTDPVLPGIKGGPLHYQNFQRRHWQPIVSQLAKEGAISFYLSQYHARHTWITAALAVGMDPKDVSYLARVSIEVLYRHYVGRSRRIIVPEF
jgi:integrase